MDNILIMEFSNSTKCIFQDPFRQRDGQVLLHEMEDVIVKVLKNEHGLLGNGVFDKANMASTTAKQHIVYVLKVLEIDLMDVL